MTAVAVRKRIPFLVEHPAGAELFGPLQRGESRSVAGKPVEYPGRCRCCQLEMVRSEVNPEYLDNLSPNQRSAFVDKLCAKSVSGRIFFPRNCATCDRRGRDLEPTSAAV